MNVNLRLVQPKKRATSEEERLYFERVKKNKARINYERAKRVRQAEEDRIRHLNLLRLYDVLGYGPKEIEAEERYLAQASSYARKRETRKLMAMPKWANQEAITQVYEEAVSLRRKTGIRYTVDHIVPLNHPLVCGLHWEGNLQLLTIYDNSSKGNHWWPDMP